MKAKERNALIEEFKNTTWILYGQETDNKKCFMHIYEDKRTTELCFCEGKICKLEFSIHKDQSKKTTTKKADYHGWISFEDGNSLSMIWPSQTQFKMCFPYGPDAEEDKNTGIMVRLNIKVLEEVE